MTALHVAIVYEHHDLSQELTKYLPVTEGLSKEVLHNNTIIIILKGYLVTQILGGKPM